MAEGTNIKIIKTSDGNTHQINTKYIQDNSGNPMSWANITALLDQKLKLYRCTDASDTPLGVKWIKDGTEITGTLAAGDAQKNTIYLVPVRTSSGKDIYDEYIVVEYVQTFTWERIGSTDIDLSGYVEKGKTYTSAAISAGRHSHSVTGSVAVPVVNTTPQYITATADTPVITGTGDHYNLLDVGDTGSITVSTVLKSNSTITVTSSLNTPKHLSASLVAAPTLTVSTSVTVPTSITFTTTNVVGPRATITITGDSTGAGAHVASRITSLTTGTPASWSTSVDSNGELSFTFSEGTAPQTLTFSQVSGYEIGNYLGGGIADPDSKTVVTGVSFSKTTSVPTMFTVSAPTINVKYSASSNTYTEEVLQGVTINTATINASTARAIAYTNDQGSPGSIYAPIYTSFDATAPTIHLASTTTASAAAISVQSISVTSGSAPILASTTEAGVHTHDVYIAKDTPTA